MLKIAHAITLSDGWRRHVMAFIAGAIGALALAPVHVIPAAFVPMIVSVLLLDGLAPVKGARFDRTALRQAGLIGWFLGFGYFVAGLWWLGAAFLVDAEEFAWALPFGVAGLPAILGCFTAFGMMLARLLWSTGSTRILALALALGLSEWLRGTLFTGFPWNDFGMMLAGNLVLAQSASLFGLHGLTFLSVFIFASPAVLLDRSTGRKPTALLWGLILLVALTAFGAQRLAGASDKNVAGVKIRIMQPNVPQDDRFRIENKDQILDQYLRLSAQPSAQAPNGLSDVTHLIWPESAFPFILSRDPDSLARISRALGRVVLVTGAARAETVNSGAFPGEIRKVSYFNSIQVLTGSGAIIDTYDKLHLVPFGEYLPLSGLLENIGLRQFVHIPGGFEAGIARKLLAVPGLPGVFPLVCYEAIFPESVEPDLLHKAGVIVNVTNDGWFGPTFGPYQHLAQARLRSIESGLPFLRAANTGISAIIDPYGRRSDQLAIGVEAVLDAHLPAALSMPLIAHYPFLSPFLLTLFGFLLLGFLRWRR